MQIRIPGIRALALVLFKVSQESRNFKLRKPKQEDNWRLYERLAVAFEAENSGIELSVSPNARIEGFISRKSRQIDALIDARWGYDLSRRIIVDAKFHRRKLDVKEVESFEGMMKDCRAAHGILICNKGWSEGAKRRAQDAITIKLLTSEEIEERTSWASFDKCIGECHRIPNRYSRKGLVLWDAEHLLNIGGLCAVVYTGKCDICHNFHIWCWDCGEKFAIGSEDQHECYCKRMWVSVIEEEIDDPTGKTLNAVHLLLQAENDMFALDRRRLR